MLVELALLLYRRCILADSSSILPRAMMGFCGCAQDVPRLEIPLHTLIELVPTPDGRMAEERIPFNIRRSMDMPPRTQMEKQFSEMITLSINRDAA